MSDIAAGPYSSPFAGLGGSLRRNRRRMLLTFLGCTVLCSGIALQMSPIYRAQSVLMVRLGPEYLVNGDPANTNMFEEHQEIVASEAAMVQTPQLAIQVIEKIGLARIYPGIAADIDPADPASAQDAMERAAIKLQKNLSVVPVKDTTLLDVSYKNPDPQVAADVLQAIVAGYLQDRKHHFEYGNGDAMSQQLDQTSRLLQDRTTELEAIKKQYGITDFEKQTADLFADRLDLVRARNAAVLDAKSQTVQVATLSPLVNKLESTLLQTTIGPGPGELELRGAVAKLQLERNDMRVVYNAGAPQLDDLQRRISTAEGLMRTYARDKSVTTSTGRAKAYDDLMVALGKAQAQAAGSTEAWHAADEMIKAASDRISELEDQRFPYERKLREVTAAQDAFFQAAKRVNEARAHDQMMEAAKPNVEVVQAARRPYQETWTRIIIAAAGMVLGLLGAGTILYLDDVSRSWRTQ